MTSKFAHTVVLPPLRVGGQELHFFCDLTRDAAIEELIASIDAWLDLHAMPETEQIDLIARGMASEDNWYDLASQRMRANMQSLQSSAYRDKVLSRIETDFFAKHAFPEVQAALKQLYSLHDSHDGPKTACLH